MAEERRVKIVLVEDQLDTQTYCKTLLKNHLNADVYATDNGEDAVRLVNEHQPDLIIQDLWIKGKMNGHDCVRQYRAFHDKVKIIVISGDMRSDGPNDLELLSKHAINASLTKPFSLEGFMNIVKKVLKEDYSYKEYERKAKDDVFIKVSPEAESIIHTVIGMLNRVQARCDHYWSDYTTDPYTIGSSPKEIALKATESLKLCTAEIECIAAELNKIKFLD